MKQETVLKGHDLLAKMDAVQGTKTLLDTTSCVELSNSQIGRVIDIRPALQPVFVNVSNTPTCPGDLKEQTREEIIKFIQRCKRHCDELEHRLKEELEDLA